MELDWLLRETGPELFKEEMGRFGFALLVGQVMLGGNRKNLVTPRLLQSFFIGETERIVAVKRFGCKPDGRRFCVDRNASMDQGWGLVSAWLSEMQARPPLCQQRSRCAKTSRHRFPCRPRA